MTDPFTVALAASGAHRASAFVLALGAGLASSAGPCVAPRLLAASAFGTQGLRASLRRAAAMQAGLTCGSGLLGSGASVLAQAARHSGVTYAVLAAVLAVCGARSLFPRSMCGHGESRANVSLSSAFLVGGSFALIVSPCCTPMILGIALFAGNTLYGTALMAAFSLGHGALLFAGVLGAQRLRRFVQTPALRGAAACVNGTVLLALGGYYAVIA